jgi:hypothetical protein
MDETKPAKQSGNPFTTLVDLIEDVLSSHIDSTKIDQILAALKTLQADVTAIKAYLRMAGTGQLSAADQAALDLVNKEDAQTAQQLSDLSKEVESINTKPPSE